MCSCVFLQASWESVVPLLIEFQVYPDGLCDAVRRGGTLLAWSVSLPRIEPTAGLVASFRHSNWQTGCLSPGSWLPSAPCWSANVILF